MYTLHPGTHLKAGGVPEAVQVHRHALPAVDVRAQYPVSARGDLERQARPDAVRAAESLPGARFRVLGFRV
jgi:hypothetical protein